MCIRDRDKDVPADRKYLVFVSDGITYMYNEKPTAVAWSFKADTNKYFAGPDNWKSQYENNNPPVNWSDTCLLYTSSHLLLDRRLPSHTKKQSRQLTAIFRCKLPVLIFVKLCGTLIHPGGE